MAVTEHPRERDGQQFDSVPTKVWHKLCPPRVEAKRYENLDSPLPLINCSQFARRSSRAGVCCISRAGSACLRSLISRVNSWVGDVSILPNSEDFLPEDIIILLFRQEKGRARARPRKEGEHS